jgi:hypothetical protein
MLTEKEALLQVEPILKERRMREVRRTARQARLARRLIGEVVDIVVLEGFPMDALELRYADGHAVRINFELITEVKE